jgi:DNA-binding Lrp family transcriptional regulator
MPKAQASSPAFTGFRQLPGGGFSFTMVPNQFLDEIVPFEKPCVVKVVCLILRRTLGWIDQTGQRRQQDQVAYSEFAREMNMSTQAVADGLKIALDKGYIIRVKAGTMRDAISGNPEAACYSLRWISPLPAVTPAVELSQTIRTNREKALAETANLADSGKQTDPASLIIRDMINKADSEKINQVELKTNSKTLICKKPEYFSSYIGNLVSDIGQQFGDGDHRLSNIKQALNWWAKSRLAENEFVRLLYKARDLTRQHTNALTNPAKPGSPFRAKPGHSSSTWVTLAGTPAGTEALAPARQAAALPRNRMPYFFKVLQDLVNRPVVEPGPGKNLAAPPTGQTALAHSNPSRKQPFTLHNLAQSTTPLGERKERLALVEAVEPVKQLATPTTVMEPRLQSIPDPQAAVPLELARLAGRFSVNCSPVLAGWQAWEASLADAKLKALARRALPIERNQVRSELQALFFPPENKPKVDSTDLLLVFRNAFDARYAKAFITEIIESLRKFYNNINLVYITQY